MATQASAYVYCNRNCSLTQMDGDSTVITYFSCRVKDKLKFFSYRLQELNEVRPESRVDSAYVGVRSGVSVPSCPSLLYKSI